MEKNETIQKYNLALEGEVYEMLDQPWVETLHDATMAGLDLVIQDPIWCAQDPEIDEDEQDRRVALLNPLPTQWVILGLEKLGHDMTATLERVAERRMEAFERAAQQAADEWRGEMQGWRG
jgi:hypothetical protein